MKSVAEIDALGSEKWQRGLCHLFAEALQSYLGRGQIGAIWVDDDFKHVYLSLDGFAYDSLGLEEKEEVFWERWRLKYGSDAALSHAKVSSMLELSTYGVRFGDTWSAILYSGPESYRWSQEARTAVSAHTLFQAMKSVEPVGMRRQVEPFA